MGYGGIGASKPWGKLNSKWSARVGSLYPSRHSRHLWALIAVGIGILATPVIRDLSLPESGEYKGQVGVGASGLC